MAQLSANRIATAALDILKRRGVAGFTMRAVAQSLRVTPMALYKHVPDKAGLAALVINAAISEHRPPSPTGMWQEDLWMLARWTRESRMAYPALAELQRAYRVWTPAMHRYAEHWMSHWLQSGLDPERAVLAASTSALAVGGLIDQESMFRELQPSRQAMRSMKPYARLFFSGNYHERRFEEGVRSIIEGLHARTVRDQQRVQSSSRGGKCGARSERQRR